MTKVNQGKRQVFDDAFRREAVPILLTSGRTLGQVGAEISNNADRSPQGCWTLAHDPERRFGPSDRRHPERKTGFLRR